MNKANMLVRLGLILMLLVAFGFHAVSQDTTLAAQPKAEQDTGKEQHQQPVTQAAPSPAQAKANDAATKEEDGDKDTEKDPKRKTHFHLGPIMLGEGYTRLSGRFFDPFGGYGFYPYNGFYQPYYGPYYYDPLFSPYYNPGYLLPLTYAGGRGEVKLSADVKEAEVYLDGAYAGKADHLKSMWLDPGAYDLSLSTPKGASFHQRIYVLSGKSLKIKARLTPDKQP